MWLKPLNLLFYNFIWLILLFGLNQYDTCVEATSKHAKPLGSWFNSLEELDLQDNRVILTTTDHFETAKNKYKKKHKKKRFKKKDNKERTVSEEVKPKKKRKMKQERKFVKTVMRDKDGEYNASSSIEYDDHRKPVDIIVHIKMHD